MFSCPLAGADTTPFSSTCYNKQFYALLDAIEVLSTERRDQQREAWLASVMEGMWHVWHVAREPGNSNCGAHQTQERAKRAAS
jgi:hypothetical protein